MRPIALAILTILTISILGPAAVGCGDDRDAAGLSPPPEEAVPTSQKELDETEAERQQQEVPEIE